jgi:uncharacterized protein
MSDVRIYDERERSRYSIEADGRLAGFVTYKLSGQEIAFKHAEIEPSLQRKGLASDLVQFALDDAERRGLDVLPYCPFVRSYIFDHPEYRDLVPTSAWDSFDL